MEPLWHSIVQGLHGIGIHLDDRAAGSIAAAGNQVSGAMDLPSLLALAAALGWASGFRLYAVVFLVGAAGQAGWIALPPGLAVLQHPVVLIASGVLLGVEFFADKIPGVDSLWDLMQSVIRIPAGAALAAGALGADGATAATLAALLGGTLAATSQAAKTTTRAAINTSPEPFSNLLASLVEDGLVVGAVWLATTHPVVFGFVLLITVVLMWVVTVLLFKFLRAVLRRLSALFSGSPKAV
ncbi:DUF4126 domain-containing protein [Candidatus Skiveiella danica]|uniref:DUF4126 domain-containing protein n=1 Tax=Candidatus Skiveiella danica TaxID=3386177 RepID=UPI001D6C91C6|nr:DUF4126 domain-containing protein [Betaproteobacteria bacterium]